MLCSNLYEVGPVVLEKKFLKFVNILSLCPYHLPFEKDVTLKQIPFTQVCFVPSLVEIGQVVLEKKMKIWKINRWTEWQTNRQTTEKRQSEKLTFISGEVKNYFASCLVSSILKLGTVWLPILHTMIYVRFSIITSHNLDWKFMQVHKNKRPMGHIAHLKKQFKSINTYDYIITLIKDVRSWFLRTFLDRSSISKILHHISFLLVNLGFTMPIKLYWN